MYIGNDLVIESKRIIAILDVDLVNQSKRIQSIIKKKNRESLIYGTEEDAKSVILTDEYIYYSPLSTLTLKNRDELYKMI